MSPEPAPETPRPSRSQHDGQHHGPRVHHRRRRGRHTPVDEGLRVPRRSVGLDRGTDRLSDRRPARPRHVRDVRAGMVDRHGRGRPRAPFSNDSPKYVVGSTMTDAERVWRNSTVAGSYSADRIRALKDEVDGDLYVSGSATLVRALVADGLVDELHLYVYPVVVGTGIRLFPDGAPRTALRLLGTQDLSNGVAHLTYGPAPAAG